MYRGPGIPDPYKYPAEYCSAVQELMTAGRIAWGPILIPISGDARSVGLRAGRPTSEPSAPHTAHATYSYVESRPSEDVKAAVEFAYRTCLRELGIRACAVRYFQPASGREGEQDIITFDTPTGGFTYRDVNAIWINAARDRADAAKATAHELKHRHDFNAFPSLSKQYLEASAAAYAARFWQRHQYAVMSLPRHAGANRRN